MTKEEALNKLYQEIPDLREAKTLLLPLVVWQRLNDLEFTVLYTLPRVTFIVPRNTKTYEYIENRRRILGLTKAYEKDK